MAAVPTHGVAGAGASRVAAVVAKHERTLLRVARQASLCDDDAFDALQRALEIFMRRVDTVDPATELAWLRVVRRRQRGGPTALKASPVDQSSRRTWVPLGLRQRKEPSRAECADGLRPDAQEVE